MKQVRKAALTIAVLFTAFTVISSPAPGEQPSRETSGAFDAYVQRVESRLIQERRSSHAFPTVPKAKGVDGQAELQIERLTPADAGADGALLHHWRGTTFVRGVGADDLMRLLGDAAGYTRVFAPQVLRSSMQH